MAKRIFVTTVPGALDRDIPVDIYEEVDDDEEDEEAGEENE